MNEKDPLAIVSMLPMAERSSDAMLDTPAAADVRADPDLDPQPVRPQEPDAADCCGEGCVRCVYDRYDETVERYKLALAAWQARHPQ